MNPWRLRWHYFGDIETLITGYGPKDDPGGLTILNDLLAMDRNDLIRVLKTDTIELISMIRNYANQHRSACDFCWEEWPADLEVIVRSETEGEMIITPRQLILPWPFPVKDRNKGVELESKVGSGVIDDLGNEYDRKRDVKLRSFWKSYDQLVSQTGGVSRTRAEELMQSELDLKAGGQHNEILMVNGFLKSTESYITASDASYNKLDVELGWIYHRPLTMMLMLPHPDGAFGDIDCVDCPEPPPLD